MNEVKFFTGVSDSGELHELFMFAKEEGYIRVDRPEDVSGILKNLEAPIMVIIHGGLAADCVVKVARLAIESGAEEVQIPLADIRSSWYDYGNGGDQEVLLWERKESLLTGLEEQGLDKDSRIHLIWP